MIQPQATTLAHQLPKIGNAKVHSFELTFPRRARPRSAHSNLLSGLVASSDGEVLQKLAQSMRQCDVETFLAFTLNESKRIVDSHEVCLVLCDERLIDGNYEDILSAIEGSRAKTPVIVVSRTGDWPDYLKATAAGVFDYQAYPPILGELPRAIRSALASRTANTFGETATKISNSSQGEMP